MPPNSDYAAEIATRRARREAGLREPDGWLALVGLHWLSPGTARFGHDPSNEVVLHAERGDVPPVAGELRVEGNVVTVHPAPGVALTVDGDAVPEGLILADDEADDGPTVLELASLRLHLIRRGAHGAAIRVKDTFAPALSQFTGLDYFPADPAWRLDAQLEPAPPGTTIQVPDVLGELSPEPSPGSVIIEAGGARHRLQALEAQPGHLWLIFGDATNGSETYGAGRFLVTGPVQPDNGVQVDFNLAYNPPCVFSPYATCPLPPAGNRLPFLVEAGEKDYHAGH